MQEAPPIIRDTLTILRSATAGSRYDGKLWLVGGWVRDKVLGLPAKQDIDIVLEGDALELAQFLYDAGVSDHFPVTYPRFGTAMVSVAGQNVELVTARRESYSEDSRKPDNVTPATIEQDAARRDFTINTLIENLHTGEIVDPLGKAYDDIAARLIRTPLEPSATFHDDPLRMLRGIRFAVRLGFDIEHTTWDAIKTNAHRLAPPQISAERIRDEFVKIIQVEKPSIGLDMLRETGLLAQFAPELLEMWGCTQNEFHAYPVWQHVMLALDNLVANEPSASLDLRLAVLLHDIGKPRTRSVGDDGRIHFYGHEDVGAEMTRKLLNRLKFSGQEVNDIANLVAQHMRIGEYKPNEWSNAAVRRFVRAVDGHLDELFAIHRADVSALAPTHMDISRATLLRERIDTLEAAQASREMTSPLTGEEIMALLHEPAGRDIGIVKTWLMNAVIDGQIDVADKERAAEIVRSGVWRG